MIAEGRMRTVMIALAVAGLAAAPALGQPAKTKTEVETLLQALDVFCGWNQLLTEGDRPTAAGLQLRAQVLGWTSSKNAPYFAQRRDPWGYSLVFFTQNDKGPVYRVEERPAIPPDATRDPKAVMAAVEGWVARTLPGAKKTKDRAPANPPTAGHAITVWDDPSARRTVTIYESPDSDARILNITMTHRTAP
jgi:hypothetical protein